MAGDSALNCRAPHTTKMSAHCDTHITKETIVHKMHLTEITALSSNDSQKKKNAQKVALSRYGLYLSKSGMKTSKEGGAGCINHEPFCTHLIEIRTRIDVEKSSTLSQQVLLMATPTMLETGPVVKIRP